MSLEDPPASELQRAPREAEPVVRRVDRASPFPDKITRAEELRLQLADEIVHGGLGADRVIVMKEGRIVDEFKRGAWSAEQIVGAATGAAKEAA